MRLAKCVVAFEFDPETGNLIQITDLRTGIDYLKTPQEGRLFHIFVPDDENWIDRYAESHESGRPEITLSGETLTIRFQELRIADGSPSGIRASVRVSLLAGDDEARFTLELINDGPYISLLKK